MANFTAYLIIDSDASANCDQTFFLRCFKSCVSFQTWKQQGNQVTVETTPDMFTGYSCNCTQFSYTLTLSNEELAVGPAAATTLNSAFTSIQSKHAYDGKLQTIWNLQQSAASCSASYCITPDSESSVLGVKPNREPCFYGSPAYYLQTFWWAIVMAVIVLCCCCCFARRRRILRRNNTADQGIGEDNIRYGSPPDMFDLENIPSASAVINEQQQPETDLEQLNRPTSPSRVVLSSMGTKPSGISIV